MLPLGPGPDGGGSDLWRLAGRGCSLDLLGCLSERIERSRIAVELPLRMDIEKDQGIKTIRRAR